MPLELASHGSGDLGIVNDTTGGHEDPADSGDVRFAFLQLLRRQPLALQTIGCSALPKRAHALHFHLIGGDQQLTALIVDNAVLVTERFGSTVAFQAELRLQATRRVVDAGVDDPAIVPRLMLSWPGLFLEQQDFRLWVGLD
ncbi:hypothetical protein D3C76_1252310 [compost metagenome]